MSRREWSGSWGVVGLRRLARLACVAGLVCLAACGGGPFDEVSIAAVELRQAPKLEFLRARAGMKFLEVRFEIENHAKTPLKVKALDFALRDASGTLHPFSAQVLDLGQPRGTVEAVVPAGAKLPGSVVFQIPEAARPAELVYRQELGGGLVVRL